MRIHPLFHLVLSIILLACTEPNDDQPEGNGQHEGQDSDIGRVFIYQGDYAQLGTLAENAALVAQHDYAVFTHAFLLSDSSWANGHCLDAPYESMAALMVQVRTLNPDIFLFGYVAATADHPNGCWPVPSVQLEACEDGVCTDFITWVNRWLELETAHEGLVLDGIFIDLAHEALISPAVRDNLFSYVHLAGKQICANVLSDTSGISFALASEYFLESDLLFIEGYYQIAGNPNVFTAGMNELLQATQPRWVALISEPSGIEIDCDSPVHAEGVALIDSMGGLAYTYQASDLGTVRPTWSVCP